MSALNSKTSDLNLTDDAKQHLTQKLKKEQTKNPQIKALRFGVEKSGCRGLSYKEPVFESHFNTDEDEAFIYGDLTVWVDKDSLNFMKGLCIDYVSEKVGNIALGGKLTYINPRKSFCGCGVSFSELEESSEG